MWNEPAADVVTVSDRMYTRLTRLAIFAVADLAVILVALATPGSAVSFAFLAIASVAIYVGIGPYQADLALNASLDDDERRRWRIALYVVPWAMALYWHRFVRR